MDKHFLKCTHNCEKEREILIDPQMRDHKVFTEGRSNMPVRDLDRIYFPLKLKLITCQSFCA